MSLGTVGATCTIVDGFDAAGWVRIRVFRMSVSRVWSIPE